MLKLAQNMQEKRQNTQFMDVGILTPGSACKCAIWHALILSLNIQARYLSETRKYTVGNRLATLGSLKMGQLHTYFRSKSGTLLIPRF